MDARAGSSRPTPRRSASPASTCRRAGAGSRFRRSTSGAGKTSRPTGAATGRCGFSWRCSCFRCSRNSSPTTSRSSSTSTASRIFPAVMTYPDTTFAKDAGPQSVRHRGRLPRRLSDGSDREGRRHRDLAADPLLLQHAGEQAAVAIPVQADLAAERRRIATSPPSMISPNAASSNPTGSAPTTAAATWWRG